MVWAKIESTVFDLNENYYCTKMNEHWTSKIIKNSIKIFQYLIFLLSWLWYLRNKYSYFNFLKFLHFQKMFTFILYGSLNDWLNIIYIQLLSHLDSDLTTTDVLFHFFLRFRNIFQEKSRCELWIFVISHKWL